MIEDKRLPLDADTGGRRWTPKIDLPQLKKTEEKNGLWNNDTGGLRGSLIEDDSLLPLKSTEQVREEVIVLDKRFQENLIEVFSESLAVLDEKENSTS